MSDDVFQLTHLANIDMQDATRCMVLGQYSQAAALYARSSAMRSAAILILLAASPQPDTGET